MRAWFSPTGTVVWQDTQRYHRVAQLAVSEGSRQPLPVAHRSQERGVDATGLDCRLRDIAGLVRALAALVVQFRSRQRAVVPGLARASVFALGCCVGIAGLVDGHLLDLVGHRLCPVRQRRQDVVRGYLHPRGALALPGFQEIQRSVIDKPRRPQPVAKQGPLRRRWIKPDLARLGCDTS